jgi:hypothetical protein
MVNALSINFTDGRIGGASGWEMSFFWGSRWVSEKFGDEDIGGWSNVVGGDLRFDISESIDFGLAGTVRGGLDSDSFAWSAGPSLGLTPFDNGWLSVGWNFAGFHDRDFEASRYTRSGPYVTMRLKFDQTSFEGLGLRTR